MTRHRGTAAALALACAVVASAAGAAQAAPTAHRAPSTSAGEVDRNLIKPPPGGVLAPVADVVGKILPR